MPLATLRPTQGQSLRQHAMGDTALACFGWIPWIDCQGVQRARQRQSDDVNDDGNKGNSDGSNANDRDGGKDGNNDEGDIDGNGGGNDDYDNNDVNDNDNDNDDDDAMATTTMERQGWNDNNVMAMGSQVLCHPSEEATINLCRRFGEESMRERDVLGGRKDSKGLRWKRLGGDPFISTQSIPNQLFAHPWVANTWDPIPHVSWE